MQSAAPSVVPARVGASENAFDVPVTWDWSGITDAAFDGVGVVQVPGAASADGASLTDPRVFFAGYGPTASTIGANRSGRRIARAVVARLP